MSNSVRDYVQRHYPTVPEARLQVIPRGVDVAQFPRVARADRRPRLALAADYPWLAKVEGPLLLLPGRGTRLKGHAHALQLLADVRAAGVPAQLWMLGTDEPGREAYVADLRRQAAALGVTDAVQIDLPALRRMDVPPLHPAGPVLLLLRAHAAGAAPAIARRVPVPLPGSGHRACAAAPSVPATAGVHPDCCAHAAGRRAIARWPRY